MTPVSFGAGVSVCEGDEVCKLAIELDPELAVLWCTSSPTRRNVISYTNLSNCSRTSGIGPATTKEFADCR